MGKLWEGRRVIRRLPVTMAQSLRVTQGGTLRAFFHFFHSTLPSHFASSSPYPLSPTNSHTMSTFSVKDIVRPNILALKPYRCARDDYSEGVLLDANENAYGPALNPSSEAASSSSGLDINRYPDPHQHELKNLIAKFRGLSSPEHFFLGVGSDEVIDMIFRVFCVPGKDAVLITPPTYGMYSVCAQINDVAVQKATLTLDGQFQLNFEEVSLG